MKNQPGQLRRNLLRSLLWALGAVVAIVGGIEIYHRLDASVKDFDVVMTPSTIAADNVSSALLEIRIISRFGHRLNVRALPEAPRIEIVQGKELIRNVVSMGDSLRYRLIAGITPGEVVVRVHIVGVIAPIEAKLFLTASLADGNHNGYPDLLDLSSESDRTAFRRWFTTIALAQRTHLDDRWQDRDCAGLLRYCYREALKRHDNTWLRSRQWLVTSSIPDVRKYNYPDVPVVGTRVFNAGGRESRESDNAVKKVSGDPREVASREPSDRPAWHPPHASLANFSEFAEAARLKDNSLAFLSRDPDAALPGDVMIYLNDTESQWPYHTMIYLGNGMTVYHTGPDGKKPGIVKRLTLAELAAHPNPRWHPVPSNPYFLGFYRWRILM
ncbi:MAG: hypothetical protein JWQ98_1870 [Chlorobi bacterium]|nr:hypothetical protein [Chlorobiota bacterium]